jgi:nucleotide-binding universal stress UspA family protein
VADVPFATSVLHPTDFSAGSERAFADALAVAILSEARLDILHAGRSLADDWERFPAVRRTLERWGLLESGSPRSAVYERLGVAVRKIEKSGRPARACLRAIHEIDPDLVVLATEGRDGVARWLRPSVAEAIAHRTAAATLFVPTHGRGLASTADGSIALERNLVPVPDRPSPANAVERAEQFVRACRQEHAELTALRVNGPAPSLPVADGPRLSWRQESARGDVIEEILRAADRSDLIVMATEGTHGVWDALRGSTTSRVVRAAPCPVLAVPAG